MEGVCVAQVDREANHTPDAVPVPRIDDKQTRSPERLPSTDFPMELSESDIALMKRIVVRYRGAYLYLADR